VTLSDGDRFVVGSDRTYLRWRPAGHCEFTVAGYDVRSGSARWTARIRPPERDREGGTALCDSAWAPQIDAGALLVTTPDGQPRAIDVDSGGARWSGDSETYPTVMAGDLMVAHHRWKVELTGYDLATGERRWVSELPKDGEGGPESVHRALVAGDRFVYQTTYDADAGPERELTWAREARTGRLEWIGEHSNALLGGGADWLVTRGRRVAGDQLARSPSPSYPGSLPKYSDWTGQFIEIRLFAL